MPDIHSFEPIWENWVLDEKIGQGSFGEVWRAHRQDPYSSVVHQAAIKHISIPREDSADEEMFFSNRQSQQRYYDAQLSRLIVEIETMIRLSGHTNIVSCEEHKVVPKKDGSGYDLFVRMELLTSLPSYIRRQGCLPDRAQVIKLGTDIARALEVLQKNHLIHRDIKPANLFVSAYGDFKLGDFGTARVLEGNTHASTRIGTLNYMAPEVYAGKTQYDQTVDIYSLGIVLYRYTNGGFLPFVSEECADAEAALVKRIMGTPLPPPAQADSALAKVILKACAFRPEDRYQTATALREALAEAVNEPVSDANQMARVVSSVKVDLPAASSFQQSRPTEMASAQDVTVPFEPRGAESVNLPSSGSNREPLLEASQREAARKGETAPAKERVLSHSFRKRALAVAAVAAVAAVCLGVAAWTMHPLTEEPSSDAAAIVMASVAPVATPSATATPEPSPTSSPIPTSPPLLERSKMVADSDILWDQEFNLDPNNTVMGSDILRTSVRSIRFVDVLPSEPVNAWDVSQSRDGSVLAWTIKNGDLYDLIIAGEGGVRLNEDSSHLFQGYTSVIKIDFGGCVDTSGVTNMSSMFSECHVLTELDVSGFNTSNVTDMFAMFNECYALNTLDVSGFDTSKVTDISAMFRDCYALTALDVSGFNTSNVTDIRWMFGGCYKLTALNVAGFDTSNVTNMCGMFNECQALNTLDVSGFNTSNVTDMRWMFNECYALSTLDVSGFNTNNVTDMHQMFSDCKALTALDLSGFDMSSVTKSEDMLTNCPADITVNGKSMTSAQWLNGDEAATLPHPKALMASAELLLEEDPATIDGFTFSHLRSKVSSVTFKDSVSDAPEDAWDVSADKDGSVLAWAVKNGKLYDLTIAGEGGIRLNEDCSQLFQDYTSMTSIDFGGCVDTSGVTDMSSMFSGCKALTTLNVGRFDTSNVTNRSWMFKALAPLNLSGFDTSNVTNMSAMFRSCESLTTLDLSGFDTSNVTNMSAMFKSCGSLTTLDLSGFDTSNVTDMCAMFQLCGSLTTLDVSGFDTSSVTDMSAMFDSCRLLTTLDVNRFDTSNVTNMSLMFNFCESLKMIDVGGFDTSSVTDMYAMFHFCGSLTTLDVSGFSTSNVADMRKMFSYCKALTALDLSGFDMSSVTESEDMLTNCPADITVNGKTMTSTQWLKADETVALPHSNVLMASVNTLLEEDNSTNEDLSVFGSELSRDEIGSIIFKNNVSSAPDGAWDVSADKDGSVLAWVVKNGDLYDLTIAGEGGVRLNEGSGSLFQGYMNVTKIDFGDCVDTSGVRDMSAMFSDCYALTELDVSGFDTCNVTNMNSMFSSCYELTELDVSKFDSSNATDLSQMFIECESLTTLDVSGFDTNNVTDMGGMFGRCINLAALDVSGFDTSNVTEMNYMFGECFALTTLDVSGFKTDKVTNMGAMFELCTSLTALDVSGFNTRNVTEMGEMFYGCESLTTLDVSGFNTNNVTDMSAMFEYCMSLTALDVSGFNTRNVTNMSAMFELCTSLTALDVSGFNTSKVWDMSAMFSRCESLTKLDVSGFDTSKVTDMGWMFCGCKALTALDVSSFNTRNVTDMRAMFELCTSLTALDVSRFDTSEVTDMCLMFSGCKALTELNVSGFNTSNAKDMWKMFNECESLTALDVSRFDTSKVTDMSLMFCDCKALTELDLSSFDMSSVTESENMFSDCPADITVNGKTMTKAQWKDSIK